METVFRTSLEVIECGAVIEWENRHKKRSIRKIERFQNYVVMMASDKLPVGFTTYLNWEHLISITNSNVIRTIHNHVIYEHIAPKVGNRT